MFKNCELVLKRLYFVGNIKKNPQKVGYLVGLPGFEPRRTEPKSVVLPLYYRPKP